MNIESLIKQMAYNLMAITYYISYPLKIQKDKILLIMTHDDSSEGNIGLTRDYFHEQNPDFKFKIVTKKDYQFNENLLHNLIKTFIKVPYHMATSQMIFLDNVFLPISKINLKKETKLIQLWHGTASLKKFALDSESGWVKNLAKNISKKTTHFIVASNWMADIYKTAFEAEDDKIYVIGCPRTDLFFNEHLLENMCNKFYGEYPELKSKKLILYAPTFRDNELNADIHLDIGELLSNLSDEYVIGLRLHPHIASQLDSNILNDRVYDFSKYNRLNTLLIVSDVLISDYSSIIFEYALLNKPILFYAYDFDEFKKNSRGFYEDYESIVPGPILTDTLDLIPFILSPQVNDLQYFRDKYLEKCDGESVKRLYTLLND